MAVPLRILAVMLALVVALAAGAIIAGASDNTSLPTCRDVNHGTAAPSANGDCFDGSKHRAEAGLGVSIAAGLAALGALIVSILVAATGRRGVLLLVLCGAAVLLIGLTIAVVHI